jgi:hypothetical protein
MVVSTEIEAKLTTLFKALNSGLNKAEAEVKTGETTYHLKAYVVTDKQVRVDILKK